MPPIMSACRRIADLTQTFLTAPGVAGRNGNGITGSVRLTRATPEMTMASRREATPRQRSDSLQTCRHGHQKCTDASSNQNDLPSCY